MLFNDPIFIFIFLPIMLLGYFAIARWKITASHLWLVAGSLFFYSWWDWKFLPLLLGSILINYFISRNIIEGTKEGKIWLLSGITFNILLIGVFKYLDFGIAIINSLGANYQFMHVVLPLAISFFTFQQIAYLVDKYKGICAEHNLREYMLFVTFFPQLIAGPIVHHKEMMPQFKNSGTRPQAKKISYGCAIFLLGLFKKVVLADTLALSVNPPFDIAQTLTFFEAWAGSLAYTFQLYFDFSGYADMAIGIALMFGICLPFNFNSPYKAVSIQDFWRRWHMTLGRFLKDYVYFPLGGSRGKLSTTSKNLFLTFLIGGLWHGAAWTFVIWGAMHGIAIVIQRIWNKLGGNMPNLLGWFITFIFINFTWVVFRAETFTDAIKMYKGMLGFEGAVLPQQIVDAVPKLANLVQGTGTMPYFADGTIMGIVELFMLLVTCMIITFFMGTTTSLRGWKLATAVMVTFAFTMQAVLFGQIPNEFLYFRF